MKRSQKFGDAAALAKSLLESDIVFYDAVSLRAVIPSASGRTFSEIVRKLVDGGILLRIERNKYMVSGRVDNSFEIASGLYAPSYISFESALNHYGILSQFPYEITSVTPRKTVAKEWNGVHFSYAHIKPGLFFGYVKKGRSLIAEPEKALLDQMYFAAKGTKTLALDEYDFSCLRKARLKAYALRFPRTRQTSRMRVQLEKVLESC